MAKLITSGLTKAALLLVRICEPTTIPALALR
jgi:hypothetical protein